MQPIFVLGKDWFLVITKVLVKGNQLKLKRETNTAGIVVAHVMLRISYNLLTRKEMYVDLGEGYFDKKRQQSIVRHS